MQKAFSIPLPIKKLDAAAGLVTGWAALSTDENGQPIIDWENHHISVEELTKATHKIMLKGGGNNSKDMHEVLIGDIVEAMVFSKEKTKALGLGDSNVEGLAVTLRLHDPRHGNGATARDRGARQRSGDRRWRHEPQFGGRHGLPDCRR